MRLAAWGCVAVIAVLSLLPGKDLVRTDLAKLGHGKLVEHFVAYAAAAMFVGLAYPARVPRLVLAGLLIAYAAVLEIGQLYVPGRGAAFSDFAASAAGIIAGTLLLPFSARLVGRLAVTNNSPPDGKPPPG
ncbi:MAG TPA: VanZ family protein [Vineibacter sp.]|nr:VanZ family protein [Vineibacter sp.]